MEQLGLGECKSKCFTLLKKARDRAKQFSKYCIKGEDLLDVSGGVSCLLSACPRARVHAADF